MNGLTDMSDWSESMRYHADMGKVLSKSVEMGLLGIFYRKTPRSLKKSTTSDLD